MSTDPLLTWTVTLARRVGYESQAATVQVNFSGTALKNIDYTWTLPSGATVNGSNILVPMAVGVFTATIVLNPVADTINEIDETAKLSLVACDNYTLNSSQVDTATIKDRAAPSAGTTTATGTTTADTATSGTATAGTSTVAASRDVQQNGGCGAGTGLAFFSGLLLLIGLGRR